ncbi:MAG TPA: VanZ family protein, partial [Gammaproteobacteria bacterium]|nr:VanZ family protein [Gammaproteobacteria bacterium]
MVIALSTCRAYWWRLGWLQLGLLLTLALWPEVQLPGPQGTDKVSHLLSFAWLMCWFGQVVERQRLRLAVALIAYGALIEFLQYFSGYRMGELADLYADISGILIGWG